MNSSIIKINDISKLVYNREKGLIHSDQQLKRFLLIHDIAVFEFSKARGHGMHDESQQLEDSVPLTHPLQ